MKSENRYNNIFRIIMNKINISILISILILFSIILQFYKSSLNLEQIADKSKISNYGIENQENKIDRNQLFLIYNLKTKLAGVTYNGDHWFHMAENFLTNLNKNSVLVPRNSSYSTVNEKYHIIYNLDNSKFFF